MQNLEQLRAAAALGPAQKLDRSAISKLPALILSNGLLASAVFCNADGGGENRKDMKAALDATAAHLSARTILGSGISSAKDMVDDLSKRDPIILQRATTEALAYLSYLKRFAAKASDDSEEN